MHFIFAPRSRLARRRRPWRLRTYSPYGYGNGVSVSRGTTLLRHLFPLRLGLTDTATARATATAGLRLRYALRLVRRLLYPGAAIVYDRYRNPYYWIDGQRRYCVRRRIPRCAKSGRISPRTCDRKWEVPVRCSAASRRGRSNARRRAGRAHPDATRRASQRIQVVAERPDPQPRRGPAAWSPQGRIIRPG